MSGGRLVVLDRSGRDVKSYPLRSGAIRIGRAPKCQVRVLLTAVRPHHATLLVRNTQTVIRNESDGETLVNGDSVSVAALRHGDLITVGDRILRWEYDRIPLTNMDTEAALPLAGPGRVRGRSGRAAPRRSSPARPPPRSPLLTAQLDMRHRASMPASAGGKQVAIVQPQRRDHYQLTEPPSVPQSPRGARPRTSRSESELAASKAELWIESRKTKHTPITLKPATVTPKQATPKPLPIKENTPRFNTSKVKHTPRKVSPRKSTKTSTSRESPRKSSTQSTPRESPRKSNKQVTPRQVSPRKSTSIQDTIVEVTPAQSATRQSSAKKVTPRQVTPKGAIPKGVTPKQAATKQVTPLPSTSKRASPRQVTPRQATPRQATPRQATPRLVTPRQATPRQATPRQVTPRQATPRQATPRQATPRQVTPRPSLLHRPLRHVVSAKKATPLRLTVLRKAQSAHKNKVMKIEDPTRIDHTKQAALLRMAGHGRPRPAAVAGAAVPSIRVTGATPSPKPATAPGRNSGVGAKKSQSPGSVSAGSVYRSPAPRHSSPRAAPGAVSVFEISDTESQYSRPSTSRPILSSMTSSQLASPKKSALKDPKKSVRKTESIKFDLSNLQSYQEDFLSIAEETTRGFTTFDTDATEDNTTLRYSESPNKSPTPSPRRSIHSRSSKILEQVGSPFKSRSTRTSKSIITNTSTSNLKSPRSRSSQLVEKALTSPNSTRLSRSRNTTTQSATKSIINQTWDATVESAFKSRTVSPRHIDAYSVVDLVSDNSDSASVNSQSLYDSLGTTRSSSILFGTPQTGRTTRSTLVGDALTSSTPYIDKGRKSVRSNSSPNITRRTSSPKAKTSTTPRSQSLTTPENTRPVSINSTKMSRISKSRSRLNDTELQFLDETVEESPKSSRKSKQSKPNSPNVTDNKRGSRRKLTVDVSIASSQGTVTPENQNSPEEIGTPVLSIQSLLNSSRTSLSQYSQKKQTSPNIKRKTVGVLRSQRKNKISPKSKSFTAASRSLRGLQLSRASGSRDKETTPTSAVKLIQEAVKNKHSTAKKPQSKRSIIDDLNESAIVKQLFNSPVKRKLSQSMTEMSRKHLFDDEEPPKKRTRNTIHLPRSPTNDSVLDHSERHSEQFTLEQFVSPLSSPRKSPNLSGEKRLSKKNTPKNSLSDGRRVRSLMRTSTRKSVSDEVTDLSGVKEMFETSPRNRRSSAKVAEIITSSPKSADKKKGRSPKNDLTNVSGVRDLFKRKSANNDLRRVSGVKRALARSPKNDLKDLRRVAKENANNYSDLSGVEELFNQSNTSQPSQRPQTPQSDSERLFDQLLGKPPLKAVYSKSFITNAKPKKLRRRSLRKSIELITNNVEEWLQQELNKSLHKITSKTNTPAQAKVVKELQKLATDTVEGSEIRTSRVRSSTAINSLAQEGVERSAKLAYSARKLPIKKRSFKKDPLQDSPTARNSSRGSILPLKKRVVVHSTPVKGAYDITMNATEIRAVSPIAVVNITRMEYKSPRRQAIKSPKSKSPQHVSPKKLASPKQTRRRGAKQNVTEAQAEALKPPPKGRRTTKTKVNEVTAVVTLPKTQRGAKGKTAPVQSPPKTELSPKPRGRRGNKAQKASPVTAKPKRGAKKASEDIPAPGPSPKPRRGRNQTSKPDKASSSSATLKPSPRKIRGKPKANPAKSTKARGSKAVENNTKRRRNSLVITKKAPVLSPKAVKKAEQQAKPETPKKTTRRQKTSPKKVTPVKSTKASQGKLVISKPSPLLKPQGSRRGKKPSTSPKKAIPKATKKQAQVSPEKSPTKSVARRGRRNANLEAGTSGAQTAKVASPKTKRGTKVDTQKPASPKKTSKRGANSQRSTEPSPKRGRKANVTEPVQSLPKAERRGRRANVTEAIELPAKTKRGSKTVAIKSPPKTKRGAKANSITSPRQTTRGAKSEATTAPPRTSRKRKAVDDLPTVPAKVAKNSPKPARGRKEAKPNTPKGRSRSTNKQTKVTPKEQQSTSQTKTKTAKSPAKAAKTTRDGAKAAKLPVKAAKSPVKVVKSPAKGTRSTRAAKSPTKGTKAAKPSAKGAKAAKSPAKGAETPEKTARAAKGAKAKAVKSPVNKVQEKKTMRSRKR